MVQPLWKTVWKFLKKLNIELAYDPAIPLLDTYLEKTKTLIRNITCTPMFIAALFTITKTWKQPKCASTNDWIKKLWYIYTQWNNTQPKKKKRNTAICSNVDGPREYYA